MERQIGEEFEFNEVKLKVVENKNGLCGNCYLNRGGCYIFDIYFGYCFKKNRKDNKHVKFVKTK
jgi:hypothetical protein